MKRKSKLIRNAMIFILLIILTFYIILKDQNTGEMFQVLGTVKIQYILIAVVCMCIYVTCEAINIGRTLKALDEKTLLTMKDSQVDVGCYVFYDNSITTK